MTTLSQTFTSKELGRFARFLTVGALGTFLDFGLLSLLKALGLPTAFDGTNKTAPQRVPQLNERNKADEDLLAYLQANTQDTKYMVAMPSSHD